MRTKLGLFCDKVIEAGWLAASIIVPLFFNIYSQRVFEPDKLSLLRSVAIVMSVAWLIRSVEDWRTRKDEESTEPTGLPLWQRVYKTPLVLPTLLLVLVYLISTATSVVPSVSLWGSYQRLQGTYTTLSYIVIFFLMLGGLRSKRQFRRLVTVMIVVSFPIALYGLVQHFALDPLPWGGNVTRRVASNMGNAIFVAAYLIMLVPLTLSRLLENWKEAVGRFEAADGVAGVVAFALLVGTLLVAMLLGRSGSAPWVAWVVLLVGAAASASACLLRPAERRPQVLAISLPLTFAFLVGFVWVLEIPFPPADPKYFGWGLVASLIFLLAMVPFAYYLRKPVPRLLLLAGYFVILIAQLITIFYSQSRGPLLGLLGGVFSYLAILGLIKRRVWLPWLISGGAVIAVLFLFAFNTVESPLMDSLRNMPYVGRLGKLLQTETGTGKVRVLIWEGVTDMISWHAPLEEPGEDGRSDSFNAMRPIIGYGPESMYVAYNRFYPPDLAHFEKRNASPDRSHNETFDALVITGAVGFIAYILLFSSLFYFGLGWLGLVRERWQKWAFAGLWIGGGIAGALGVWAWRGPLYIGVGLPGGMMLGLGAYVFIVILQATARPETLHTVGGHQAVWILALLSAVVAHFVEIHFGIAIAATRTYFWIYAALLVLLGTQLTPPTEEQRTITETADSVGERDTTPRRRRQRGTGPEPGPRPRRVGDLDWQGSVLILSLVTVLVLGTMLFDYITIQQDDPGLLATIWRSLAENRGEASLVMLVLFLSTWAMMGLLGFSDLATRKESAGREARDWLTGLGVFALVSLGGAMVFALLHAMRLRPVTITDASALNPLANTIVFYYAFVFVMVLALALVLSFMFRRSIKPRHWTGELGDIGIIALAVILPVLAAVLIFTTNISIIRADILYKQGLSSEKAQQWDGAIYFYDKAVQMAKDQDFYYLFLGRALMEKGKASTGQERDIWLQESERSLLQAREIAPLNTDHSANLARLYRTWGGLSQGQRRTSLLDRALDYYADATSLSPHNAQLFNEWGQTYYAMGDVEQALEMYQKSLDLDSEYLQTYLLLGEFYMQQKAWEEAAEAYERAIELKPKSVEAYSAIGYVYTQMGDLQAALQAYLKAVELQPRNFNDRKNLAILYQQMGRADDAIRQATEALALAPENQKQQMESFLAQLGQPQSAVAGENAQRIQELLTEGSQTMEAEDWAAAESVYRQVLELDPSSALAHSALAYIYAMLGRQDEAISENLAVLSLMPNDYNSHKNLAILYQQKGAISEAIAETEQALVLAPEGDKQALQAFLSQLQQMQAESPSASQPEQRAGDLPPAQRDNMYGAPPPMAMDPGKSYTATIVTRKGNIVLDLAADDAPQTVNNFVFLAEQGFYDGLTFHRVENQPGFSLIQGGDPTGTGRGGPGYTVPAEIGLPHEVGAIATARLADQVNPERASSGSQFYIALEPIPQLDGGYTVFGYVIQGLDVAKSIVAGDEILTIVITTE